MPLSGKTAAPYSLPTKYSSTTTNKNFSSAHLMTSQSAIKIQKLSFEEFLQTPGAQFLFFLPWSFFHQTKLNSRITKVTVVVHKITTKGYIHRRKSQFLHFGNEKKMLHTHSLKSSTSTIIYHNVKISNKHTTHKQILQKNIKCGVHND